MKEKKEGDRGFDIKVLGSSSWEVGAAEAGWRGGRRREERRGEEADRLHPNHPQIPVDRRTLHTSSLVC